MKNRILYSAYYTEKDPFGIFGHTRAIINPKELTTDGVLILWGGEDISPALYNQDVVHARAPAVPSKRDIVEKNLFTKAVEMGIPIIGVCRGAQLACALSGGTLFQHIQDGHHGPHLVETYDGEFLPTSSCHHQALNLENVEHELLAWDKDRITTAFTDVDVKRVVIPEVAVLNKTKTFAIQGHPEWLDPKHKFVKWCAAQLQARFA